MDARLRKRRGVLRVSASRHIDCSVRRRPFGPTPFYAAREKSLLPAHVSQVHPSSDRVRYTLQPGLQQPHSSWARQSSSTVPCPRPPCPVLVHRAHRVLPSRTFEASPLSNGDYRRKARPSQAVTFQKPPLISGYQLNRRSFEQRSRFRRLSPSFFKTHRSAYPKAKHAK